MIFARLRSAIPDAASTADSDTPRAVSQRIRVGARVQIARKELEQLNAKRDEIRAKFASAKGHLEGSQIEAELEAVEEKRTAVKSELRVARELRVDQIREALLPIQKAAAEKLLQACLDLHAAAGTLDECATEMRLAGAAESYPVRAPATAQIEAMADRILKK